MQPDVDGDRVEPKSPAPLLQGPHLALEFQVAHQIMGPALIGTGRFFGEFGDGGAAACRLPPGGLANQRYSVSVQVRQGRDPVKVETGKERLGIPPESGVRVLQVVPRPPQNGAPEGHFGRAGTLDKIQHEAVRVPVVR